jgi:hypothetical protein
MTGIVNHALPQKSPVTTLQTRSVQKRLRSITHTEHAVHG